MNVPDAEKYDSAIRRMQTYMDLLVGDTEVQCATDTCQFEDYDQYLCTVFDPEAKLARRETVFPEDLRKARELGFRLASRTG